MNSDLRNKTIWAERMVPDSEKPGGGGSEPLQVFSGSKDLAQEHLMTALVLMSSLCLVGFTLCATAAAVATYKKFFRSQTCHICKEKVTHIDMRLGSTYFQAAKSKIVLLMDSISQRNFFMFFIFLFWGG